MRTGREGGGGVRVDGYPEKGEAAASEKATEALGAAMAAMAAGTP